MAGSRFGLLWALSATCLRVPFARHIPSLWGGLSETFASVATLELYGEMEEMMKPTFIEHLRGEWPLVLAVVGMLIYIPIVLIRGVFYTNQGNFLREVDPEGYWRWVKRFLVLLLVCLLVIFGSYYLALH
jgi:hypothetical protein